MESFAFLVDCVGEVLEMLLLSVDKSDRVSAASFCWGELRQERSEWIVG